MVIPTKVHGHPTDETTEYPGHHTPDIKCYALSNKKCSQTAKTNQNKIYSPWDPPFSDDRYIYHGHRLLHSAVLKKDQNLLCHIMIMKCNLNIFSTKLIYFYYIKTSILEFTNL